VRLAEQSNTPHRTCTLARSPPNQHTMPPPLPTHTHQDSFLDEGFILDKKIGVGQPHRIENAKVLIANTPMDTDKIKIYGARVKVDSMAKVAEIEAAEKSKMREKCEKILAHGINCFVNRQLIYNYPEEIFADAGIMSIEHADFDGIERLALVLGGEIASTFDNPAEVSEGVEGGGGGGVALCFSPIVLWPAPHATAHTLCHPLVTDLLPPIPHPHPQVKLGTCKLIEEVMIGEDKLIHFSGVALGEACTIVLRGASTHILEEADRWVLPSSSWVGRGWVACGLLLCGWGSGGFNPTHSTRNPPPPTHPHTHTRTHTHTHQVSA